MQVACLHQDYMVVRALINVEALDVNKARVDDGETALYGAPSHRCIFIFTYVTREP